MANQISYYCKNCGQWLHHETAWIEHQKKCTELKALPVLPGKYKQRDYGRSFGNAS